MKGWARFLGWGWFAIAFVNDMVRHDVTKATFAVAMAAFWMAVSAALPSAEATK